VKTHAAVSFIVLLAISAMGCEGGPPPGLSGTERLGLWRSAAAQNAREDVELTVAVQGTVAAVSATNRSQKPLCTSGTVWPDGRMMGEVFLIKADGRYWLYEGPLASILGDDSITVPPGETLRGRVDIAPYYALPPGVEIETIEFSARFYDCPPKGNVP
jgi:hypothetical protein